jgi:predicted nucleic acid binding AN1-type Zn finger protein
MPKCDHCKKRTHLVFTCQCPGEFCVKCRTPEVHDCKDYVVEKVVLVKVVAEKVTPV